MTPAATKLAVWARRLAYVTLVVAVAAVAANASFLRAHYGAAYLLEGLVALWALAAVFSLPRPGLSSFVVLWPAGLFFAWGLCLLVRDLATHPGLLADPVLVSRALQHSVLFVYPLLWMAIGIWIARVDRAVAALLILIALFINTLPSLGGLVVANLSLGPLTAVVLAVCVDKTLSWPSRSAERFAYWLVSLAFGVLTFVPYWRLWVIRAPMQRTSLMMLFFMLVATPLLRRKTFSSIRNVGVTLPLFILGFFVTSGASWFMGGPAGATATGWRDKAPMSFSEHLADNFFGSIDKSGGYFELHPSAHSMSAVRRFWWGTTVADWKASPLLGVGMVPELPSQIAPGLPNDWETVRTHREFRTYAPISGPHNSYLTILARTGVAGLGLFLLLLFCWVRAIRPLVLGRELNLYEIMVIMIPVNGLIHAALNIGLESPGTCALLWLFAGAATVYARTIAEAEAAANVRE